MVAGIDGSQRSLSAWNHVRAVLLLPFMNTVIIPTFLLAAFRDARLGSGSLATESIAFGIALSLIGIGLTLVVRAIALFVRRGRGTLAPWDPTEVLITSDIYAYSRNPMKAGLFCVLIGEAVLLRSTAIAVWALAFVTVNAIYIRWFEEPGLEARFGDAWRDYRRRVPRWLSLTSVRPAGRRTAGQVSAGPLS